MTVDITTGEVLEFDQAAAERRAERINLRLESIADNTEAVKSMIREAIEKRDDLALGYRSLGQYVSDRFGGALGRLGIEVRRAFVTELTQAGMSSRAIAPVVGVSQRTVVNDAQVSNVAHLPQPPEPVPSGEAATGSGQTSGASAADTDSENPEAALSGEAGTITCPPPAPPVTGIDGKTYSRPTPKPKPIEDEWTELDRAEELARNLSRNLSLLFAITNPERRAEYIATWRDGIRDLAPLGSDFITPKHMRELSSALLDFATEWEHANA